MLLRARFLIEEVLHMRIIITTVGTSLLTNYQKAARENDPTDQALANYLHHTAAEQACAETNSLHRLLVLDDGIVFLHSTTNDGSRCADCLARHFRNRGHDSRAMVIPDLSYQESRFKMRGLRSLVCKIIEIIDTERSRGHEVVINATGGFKAEIAYATLIGLLFDVPVYYIHEAFWEIIAMPPVPISWDYRLIADHDEFFDWLDADVRPTPEVDVRLKALPGEASADARFLLVEEEGYTYLSPVGEVFVAAYRARASAFATVPVLLSEKAWRTLGAAAPDERRIMETALRKLRDPLLRRSGSAQKINSDCLVYPTGHRPERIFYFEGEDAQAYVCDIATMHDAYERMLKGGVWRKDFGGFREYFVGA